MMANGWKTPQEIMKDYGLENQHLQSVSEIVLLIQSIGMQSSKTAVK